LQGILLILVEFKGGKEKKRTMEKVTSKKDRDHKEDDLED
jgi:hypothetical protein